MSSLSHLSGISTGSGISLSIPGISLSSLKYNGPNLLSCFWAPKCETRSIFSDVRPICNAISKTHTQENNIILDHDMQEEFEANYKEVSLLNEIKEHVDLVRSMLGTIEEGQMSESPYDIAWISLIKDVNGSNSPQFPNTLQWIVNNQLSDGSWGVNCKILYLRNRLLNTLACVIALTSWNVHPEKRDRGLEFIEKNIQKINDESFLNTPCGFEVIFPTLLEIAQTLDIQVPDSPLLQEIRDRRNLKLKKIPKDLMHMVPTTLLYSLEGLNDLEWDRLLKLQNSDGSFLSSPSSTAFAFMQTKDDKCLSFLKRVVDKFDGGVPSFYPNDIYERLWVVDRLQRLGICRYFQTEINECLDYVYRFWSENGLSWARNQRMNDIDDTCMGFRLLRLHGYDVSPNVFRHFEKDGEFICFPNQSNEGVSTVYNTYRASMLMFPGESIFEEVHKYVYKFLRDKQATNQLIDKWVINKDLLGEVEYALNVPWYASLPRVETRFYIEQYGGDDDMWIAKTFYKFPYVNNNIYLELAKLDFNNCQTCHKLELDTLQEWYTNCNLEKYGISKKFLHFAYFLAAASIFEPKRSEERIGWAKTAILIETIASYFEATDLEKRSAFMNEFINKNNVSRDYLINGRLSLSLLDAKKTSQGGLVGTLLETLNQLSFDVLVTHGRYIYHHLCSAWGKWLHTLQKEGDRYHGEAELLVNTINHCGGGVLVSEEPLLSHSQYHRLSQLTNKVCHQLRHFQKNKVYNNETYDNNLKCNMTTPQIELAMQELTKLVLQNSPDDIDANIKHTFLTVTKSFYYTAYCKPELINLHMSKVLFERVQSAI